MTSDAPATSADTADVIRLDDGDQVVVAARDLGLGESVTVPGAGTVTLRGSVPRGHKLAVTEVPAGSAVFKYGVPIGTASTDIRPGDHVHTRNLAMPDPDADAHLGTAEFGTARRTLPAPGGPRPVFQGYRRADGKVGTRNYIGILTSVNCSASTAKMIADQFRGSALDDHPHVDGIIALTHGSGCGLVADSDGANVLTRTLRGYAAHPNIAGLLVLGLGCEMLQTDRLIDPATLPDSTLIETMTIQETGGIRKTVRAGVAAIEKMLAPIDALQREPSDVSELSLGLNCGGSDGYSGITANPALGVASDLLVSYGGTSILAETPEVFGAEQLLIRRAVTPDVGWKLLERIDWWKEYAAAGGGSLDNNPSPGNKAGGLTTILEKSLGAIAKSGSAELVDVLGYAERPAASGLHFMDTPGYDPVSVTGIVAGGANIVCFTTGRGSVLGCKPSPSIKLATNSDLYARMPEDMDLNCGGIVDGVESVEEAGRRIFDRILEVASGQQTVSEELDLGQDEFQPWQLGTVT